MGRNNLGLLQLSCFTGKAGSKKMGHKSSLYFLSGDQVANEIEKVLGLGNMTSSVYASCKAPEPSHLKRNVIDKYYLFLYRSLELLLEQSCTPQCG